MDQKQLKNDLKGRNPEQRKVIEYFYGAGGCMSSGLKDADYEGIILNKIKATDWKQKALDKIGLDETQVNEIDPVFFHYYVFDTKSYVLRGKDRKWRSSKYQLSYILFSSAQIYVYQYTFNLDSDEKNERTEEYFYKDITNFSSSSNTIEKEALEKNSCGGAPVYSRTQVETNEFAIVVPGDKFLCAMEASDISERAIQAMKAKLREKKV
jgi:hypothetical protein